MPPRVKHNTKRVADIYPPRRIGMALLTRKPRILTTMNSPTYLDDVTPQQHAATGSIFQILTMHSATHLDDASLLQHALGYRPNHAFCHPP
jgi:hypothetical protein